MHLSYITQWNDRKQTIPFKSGVDVSTGGVAGTGVAEVSDAQPSIPIVISKMSFAWTYDGQHCGQLIN